MGTKVPLWLLLALHKEAGTPLRLNFPGGPVELQPYEFPQGLRQPDGVPPKEQEHPLPNPRPQPVRDQEDRCQDAAWPPDKK